MSIGTALAEARRSAGLTVGQVSEKTRIRQTIIKGIERDDYAACGGDFYARGHIRAIARAVGTDPAPLIEEYDETLKAPEEITAAEAFRPAMPLWKREQESDPEQASQQPAPATDRGPARKRRPAGEPREPLWKRGPGTEPREPQGKREPGAEQREPLWKRGPAGEREPAWRRGPLWRRAGDQDSATDEESGPGTRASVITETLPPGDPHEPDTEPQPVVTAPIAETALPLEPEPALMEAEPELMEAEPALMEPPPPFTEPQARMAEPAPVGHLMPADQVPLFPPARGKPLMAGRPRPNWTYVLALALLAAVALLGYLLVGGSGSGGNGSPAAAPGSRHAPGHTRARPGHTAAPTTSPPAASPVQSLSPVSATAVGPGGTQGDDPQSAQLAITGGAWHTHWYTSANFGNLQSGTGLLLDMGRPVTITGAQMTLGNPAGAGLQLRAGNTPTIAGLSPVAGDSNAGGLVQLDVSSPVTCQYVLIWFTKLPPDSSGTFQVSVSGVKLRVVS